MRTLKLSIVLLACLVATGFSHARGQARFGVTISDGRVRNVDIAIGRPYPVDGAWIRAQGIPDRDVPVIVYLAHRSGWEPREIVRLRLDGLCWEDISTRCGLAPDCYRVALGPGYPGTIVRPVVGNPYWRFHGYPDRPVIAESHGHFRPDHPIREVYAHSGHSSDRDGSRDHERHERR